uniref:Uncharacterized protein n=1 Tax=Arundo donax TaxID=35708 RepID=A0A0A9A6G9_ARUDO
MNGPDLGKCTKGFLCCSKS